MKNIVRITIFLVLLGVFLSGIRAIGDFDTGYHLATGNVVLGTGGVPTKDIFSFTARGADWVSHYWLSDVLFAVVNRTWETYGLIFFVAILSLVTYGLLMLASWQRNKRTLLAALLSIPVGALTFELWVVRPQIFSYLFVALLLLLIERARHGSKRALFIIPLVMLFWANMHASVVFGIGLLGLWALTEIYRQRMHIKAAVPAILTSAIGILVTVLNPSGIRLHLYLTQVAPDIQEFFSILKFSDQWQAQVFLLMMALALVLALIHLRRERAEKGDWFWTGVAVTASILPLLAIRHVGLFPLLVLPALAPVIEEKLVKRAKSHERALTLAAPILALVLVAVSAVVLAGRTIGIDARVLPVAATQFLDSADIKDPIFNPPAFGGYLIWQRWPEHLVFADGRNDVYGPGGILDDYKIIIEQGDGWRDVFYEYEFNAVMVPHRGQFYEPVSNFARVLTDDMGFTLVYWDDVALIYVRDVAMPKVVALEGYTEISPFLDVSKLSNERRERALKEIARAARRSPDSKSIAAVADILRR